MQHCDKPKFLTLCMCFHVCIDSSVCLHIHYDWSVQKISITVLQKDPVIFKIYVLVYHDFNAPTHMCCVLFGFFPPEADSSRLSWVLWNTIAWLQTLTVLNYTYYHKIIGLSVPQLSFRVILYAANLKQFEKMNPPKLLILSLHEVSFEISISMRDEILGRRGFRLLRINKNGHFRELLIFPF